MTDANGTRNNSNDKPPARSVTDKASPDPNPNGPVRRTRRSEVVKSSASAASEGRRLVVAGTNKSLTRRTRSRTRRKPDSPTSVSQIASQRSRKVAALPSAKSAKSGSSAPESAAEKASSSSQLSLSRRRSRRKPTAPWLIYVSWIVIGGLGVATIGGTVLKALSGDSQKSAIADSSLTAGTASPDEDFPLQLNQEIAPLKTAFQEFSNSYPGLTAKAFYIDVDTRDYVSSDGSDSIAAASTIKLPILLAFFEDIDEGRIDPNQTMALLPEQIAEGSGEMQLSPVGTQFTALEVATQMIVTSDNTATNMMIDLLGGAAVLNERFKGYGLQKTQLNNPLPDLQGTNLTSAKDLVHTMLLISGDRLTIRSRDRILNILTRTRNKTLLAAGLFDKGALTYNKTGDIESVLGDVSLVDLSNGKRYIVAALVQRPSNDGRAIDLIQNISSRTFKAANEAIQPFVTPLGPTDTPAAKPAAATGATIITPQPNVPQKAKPADSASPAGEAPNTSGADESISIEEAPYPSANP